MAPSHTIFPLYAVLFLTLEPITALAGAYYAYFQPSYYLNETYPESPFNFLPDRLPPSIAIVLQQLSNLYLLFAINEAIVLRAASSQSPAAPGWYRIFGADRTRVDVKVWRAVLTGLLIADVGHLWSVRSLGSSLYWDVGAWNAMAWGNVGVVYAGAAARCCFLLGLGVRQLDEDKARRKR